MNSLFQQLQECKRITCTKLIPFKENGEFFVRWEGEFIDDKTLLPMQLIIPKLSMNVLNISSDRFNFKSVAVASFEIKCENTLKEDDVLFTIKVDKKESE